MDAGRHFSDGHPSGRAHSGVYVRMPSTLRPRAAVASNTRSSPLQSQVWGPSCWTSDHEMSSRTQPPSACASSRAAARSPASFRAGRRRRRGPSRAAARPRPPAERASSTGAGPASPTGRRDGCRGCGGPGGGVSPERDGRAASRIRPAELQHRGSRRHDEENRGERDRGPTHAAWRSRAHGIPSTPNRRSLIGGVSQGPFHGSVARVQRAGHLSGAPAGYQALPAPALPAAGWHDVADRLPRGDPPRDHADVTSTPARRAASCWPGATVGGRREDRPPASPRPATPGARSPRIRSESRQRGKPARVGAGGTTGAPPGCSAASASMVSNVQPGKGGRARRAKRRGAGAAPRRARPPPSGFRTFTFSCAFLCRCAPRSGEGATANCPSGELTRGAVTRDCDPSRLCAFAAAESATG